MSHSGVADGVVVCVIIGYVLSRLRPTIYMYFFFLMIRRPPRSTLDRSSAASDVYKRQVWIRSQNLSPIFQFHLFYLFLQVISRFVKELP